MNMVSNMGLTNNHNVLSNTAIYDGPLEKIINKYKSSKYNQSCQYNLCFNKHKTDYELTFTFQFVTKNQISKLMKILTDKKVVQSIDIATKIIIEFCHFFPSL